MKKTITISAATIIFLVFSCMSLKAEDDSVNRETIWDMNKISLEELSALFANKNIVSSDEGKNALIKIPQGQRVFFTIKKKIKPDTRYLLTFKGMINEDDFDLESAIQNDDMLKFSNYLPDWDISFFNADGKKIRPTYGNIFQKIISNKRKEYAEEFYTPGDSESLEIRFSNGKDKYATMISDIKLEEVKGSKYENINHNYALGEGNFSGHNINNKAYVRKEEAPEKGGPFWYMDTMDGHIISNYIPVVPGEMYKLSATVMRDTERLKIRPRLYLDFFQKNLKPLTRSKIKQVMLFYHRFPGKWESQSYDFIMPQGAAYVRLRYGGGYFKEVKFEKLPDNKTK